MAPKTSDKWQVNRRKNEVTLQIKELLPAHQPSQEPTTRISFEKGADIHEFWVYNGGIIDLDDPSLLDDPAIRLYVMDEARPYLQPLFPGWYQTFDDLRERDHQLTQEAKLEKILGAIANNIDEVPGLETEIIKLGKMLERGVDIKNYCRGGNLES